MVTTLALARQSGSSFQRRYAKVRENNPILWRSTCDTFYCVLAALLGALVDGVPNIYFAAKSTTLCSSSSLFEMRGMLERHITILPMTSLLMFLVTMRCVIRSDKPSERHFHAGISASFKIMKVFAAYVGMMASMSIGHKMIMNYLPDISRNMIFISSIAAMILFILIMSNIYILFKMFYYSIFSRPAFDHI